MLRNLKRASADDKGDNNTSALKDKENGKAASNYRSVTCLLLVWNSLTGIINEVMKCHLNY